MYEQPCVINKTEAEGNFNLSISDIPQEQLDKANKTGIDCMFNIFVDEQKMVSTGVRNYCCLQKCRLNFSIQRMVGDNFARCFFPPGVAVVG